MKIYRLVNVVQSYAWGSRTAIADLLGQPSPTPNPQAELWMGTHPKGPSMVVADDDHVPLQQLIDRQPTSILGQDVVARYGSALPYLFKVLAAARPLSIQAHPSKTQAVAGFLRENRERKALDAANRNYRDDNHKPELICALTPFWGLNGFRAVAEAAALLAPICPRLLKDAVANLKTMRERGLSHFFKAMMTLPNDKRRAVTREILDKAQPLANRSPVYRWLCDLARDYPDDLGILSPALLNLIRLEPGQAMFLPSGQLHAYLDGVGIELMANSDNVLRGGLTAKHVDVPELLKVVQFKESSVILADAKPVRPAECTFECPAAEFQLSLIQTTQDQPYTSEVDRSVEMLLCTAGNGQFENADTGEPLVIRQGDSFLVPAGVTSYTIVGKATLYKAAVPPLR